MFDDLIELCATLLSPGEKPIPFPLDAPTSPYLNMPPRHRKSQSVSSDTTTPKTPISPASPKVATPARRTRRKSAATTTTSPPASPTFAAVQPVVALERKSPILTLQQFPLVVVLSLALSSLTFSLIAEFTSGDLASISKHTESWAEVGGLIGWKVVELGIYWFGGYDTWDVVSLSLLLATPNTLLLALFYTISPYTLTLMVLANLVATATPFTLFRPLSLSHAPHSTPAGILRNKPILTDPYTTIATAALATTILALLTQLSFLSFLPTLLITRFTGLRTLEPAHAGPAILPTLLVLLAPAGVACMEFLFVPPAGVPNAYMRSASFEPATAGLGAHIYHNAWGWYSARQKELIKRTVVASLMVVAESVVQLWGTIEGVELEGAVGYAGIFGVGVVLVGIVYEWVGGPTG